MKIIEPGHVYELHTLDAEGTDEQEHKPTITPVCLTFVNREPGTEHPGTQTQEVLRALIDRTMHCDNCLRWSNNDLIIHHLRMALVLHEARALERKTEKGLIQPENIVIRHGDGHFAISADPSSEDSKKYHGKAKTDSPYRPKMPCFSETPKPPKLAPKHAPKPMPVSPGPAWQSVESAPDGEIVEGKFKDSIQRARRVNSDWFTPDSTTQLVPPLAWRPLPAPPGERWQSCLEFTAPEGVVVEAKFFDTTRLAKRLKLAWLSPDGKVLELTPVAWRPVPR